MRGKRHSPATRRMPVQWVVSTSGWALRPGVSMAGAVGNVPLVDSNPAATASGVPSIERLTVMRIRGTSMPVVTTPNTAVIGFRLCEGIAVVQGANFGGAGTPDPSDPTGAEWSWLWLRTRQFQQVNVSGPTLSGGGYWSGDFDVKGRRKLEPGDILQYAYRLDVTEGAVGALVMALDLRIRSLIGRAI